MSWMVAVDVGGTFTDFFVFEDGEGKAFIYKTLSTPDNPARAIVDGLKELAAKHDIPLSQVTRFSHGTTVATNTLIQRSGGKVALITTKGLRDLIEIGRQIRPKIFDMQLDFPPPLIPRKRRFEVAERVGADGGVIADLDDNAIAAVIAQVRESGAAGCAVCLIFSFLNPDHENRIGEALQRALPGMFVSLSSDVHPEFREYERFSTTVLNVYLRPMMDHYLDYLEEQLVAITPNAKLGINQSNGGLASINTAKLYPIRTALSGPAAGVVGAVHTAGISGEPDFITLDMGGTSADVCLVRACESGYPVRP